MSALLPHTSYTRDCQSSPLCAESSKINNKHLFDTNKEINKYKTWNNNNLHLPLANLSKFNKGAYISGIKDFNHLPQYIKALTCFKSTLKRLLYHHSFYSVNEYYVYKEDIRV